MALTLSEIEQQLEYHPVTGQFVWRVAKPRAVRNSIAGFSCKKGYTRIKVMGVTVAAHRLAWAFANGRWPAKQIDHINGVRNDNRICNLREATAFENARNRVSHKLTKTGFKGVYAMGKKFQASCKVAKAVHHLGTYSTAEEASEAYNLFASKHHQSFYNASVRQGEITMARPKSVILSKDEKKAVVAELKLKIKAAKDNSKQLAGIRKEADKAFALAGKAHVATLKENDKAVGSAEKELFSLEAQLNALTAPPVAA
jgi:hypothetical protein